jgi:hypothetical protein
MKMEQSVPKRRHIQFRRRGITQKKTYSIYKYVSVFLNTLYGNAISIDNIFRVAATLAVRWP